MSEKKLESFKIADTRKPGVTTPTPARAAEPAASPESQSLGFKRIEGLLESDEPAAVRQNLETLKGELAKLEKDATANKDKVAAKKALAAVDRAAELMDFLYKTKASMLEGGSR
jgi:hypothetical protein